MYAALMDVTPLFEDKELYEKSCLMVSEQRRKKAHKYSKYKDKCRSVGAGILLNLCLGEYLVKSGQNEGYSTRGWKDAIDYYVGKIPIINMKKALNCVDESLNWNMKFHEHGKPYFDEADNTVDSDIRFSLSHSGKYVACAVSDHNVGIDVEGDRKVNAGIARKYFTHNERNNIMTDEDFFKIWALKEAYGKITGKGVYRGMKQDVYELGDMYEALSIRYENYYIGLLEDKAMELEITEVSP